MTYNGDVCCALCERFRVRRSRTCEVTHREVIGATDARHCPHYDGPDGHRKLRYDWPDCDIRARIPVGEHILWADCHGRWLVSHLDNPMKQLAGGEVADVAGTPTNWTVFRHAKLAAERALEELFDA